MNDTPEEDSSSQKKQHPVAEAAWRGYRDYKEDMAKRRRESALHRLSLPTMLWVAAILVAGLLLIDYLKRTGWWGVAAE